MESERLREWLRRAYRKPDKVAPPAISYKMQYEQPEDRLPVVPLGADFPADALARAIGADFVGEPDSPILVRRSTIPVPLPLSLSPQSLSFFLGQSNDCEFVARSLLQGDFIVLDTETTGLAGGTGTLIFLAGIARPDPARSSVKVFQYFLLDPTAEPAFLDCVAEHLSDHPVLITYNGRGFDVPLLRNRFRLHRRDDIQVGAHLDLFIATRRLLKFFIPDRSLSSIETNLLHKPRLNDIPAELIPREYQMFLRFGEIGRLPVVFDHNLNDLLSLLDLLRLLGQLVIPDGAGKDPRIALARGLFQRRAGEHKSAYHSLFDAFNQISTLSPKSRVEMEPEHIRKLCRELGSVARSLGHWETALRVWHFWADNFPDPEPCVEIAKYYEHKARDWQQALFWADRAHSLSCDPHELIEIDRRVGRLRRRLARAMGFGSQGNNSVTRRQSRLPSRSLPTTSSGAENHRR